jgi:KDO2-lipid IV(A) lauroyltransferase
MFAKPLIWFFSFLGFLQIKLNYKARFFLGSFLGVFWFDVLRFRRKIVLENLRIAFPELSERERRRLGRLSMQYFSTHVFEVFMIPFLSKEWHSRHVIFHGEENYKIALGEGRGVLLLSLHLGHGDLGASVVEMKGYPITIITKYFKSTLLNKIWFYFRGAQGVEFIAPHGEKTPFEILKALKKQRGVVFVMDQYMGPPFGIESRFFGRWTGSAFGLGLFMRKTRAPVVPLYVLPGQDGKLHVHFEKPLDLLGLSTGNKKQDLAVWTQAVNDKIEEIIRRHPAQWMWIHRRWKEFG